MERDDLLLERLKEYAQKGRYPFHMPGHKRRTDWEFLRDFPNPYSLDITEIEGFDNLHHPEGILKASMEWAAQVYGAEKTYYLINGSTGGILSAICACVPPGETILIGRNCHKSVYHGIILGQLNTKYIYPQILSDWGIHGGISPDEVRNALKSNPEVKAVLVVSPTYDGVVSDIRGIARAAHEKGIPLIVDEAHGAHFPFGGEDAGGKGRFPVSALDQGADLVIQSLHKTLPSFTQTAVLHVRKGCVGVNIEKLESYLQMFQSSSPSYLLMAGIEACIYEMAKEGGRLLDSFAGRLERIRERLSAMKNLRLLSESVIGMAGVYDLDPAKLVVSCRRCGRSLDGKALADRLRKEFGLEMEMWGADYVVAITTFLDTKEALNRLAEAFLAIDESLEEAKLAEEDLEEEVGQAGGGISEEKLTAKGPKEEIRLEWPEPGPGEGAPCEGDSCEENSWDGDLWERPSVILPLCKAVHAPYEAVPLEKCEGRISAEFVYLYPPGIPILAPGERVTEPILRRVLRYREMGLPVQGMADGEARQLRCVSAGCDGRGA